MEKTKRGKAVYSFSSLNRGIIPEIEIVLKEFTISFTFTINWP